MMRIVGGLYIPSILLKEAFRKRLGTILNRGTPLTGIKKCAVSQDMDVEEVKSIAKKNDASINDFMTTVVGMAFRDYLDKYDYEHTKNM